MGNSTIKYVGTVIILELDLIDKDVFRDMYCLDCKKEHKLKTFTFCPFCARILIKREKVKKRNYPDLFYKIQDMVLEEENLIYQVIEYNSTIDLYLASNSRKGSKSHEWYPVTGEDSFMDLKETEESNRLIKDFRKYFDKEITKLDEILLTFNKEESKLDELLIREELKYKIKYGILVVSEG